MRSNTRHFHTWRTWWQNEYSLYLGNGFWFGTSTISDVSVISSLWVPGEVGIQVHHLDFCDTSKEERRHCIGRGMWGAVVYWRCCELCNRMYALVVLGHARHVDVRTAGHAPGVVHPGVLVLTPETGGNVANILCRIFRLRGAVFGCHTNLMYDLTKACARSHMWV
jgi:hypothetical protein